MTEFEIQKKKLKQLVEQKFKRKCSEFANRKIDTNNKKSLQLSRLDCSVVLCYSFFTFFFFNKIQIIKLRIYFYNSESTLKTIQVAANCSMNNFFVQYPYHYQSLSNFNFNLSVLLCQFLKI